MKSKNNKEGVQIDLLIIRNDNVVNLCEMKFAGDIYSIDKEEDAKIRNRIQTLINTPSPKQSVHLTVITTYEVSHTMYGGRVQQQVILDDLFLS